MNNAIVNETIIQGYDGNTSYLTPYVYQNLTDEMVKYILYRLNQYIIKINRTSNNEELNTMDYKAWEEECIKKTKEIKIFMNMLQKKFPKVKLGGFVLEYSHSHYFVNYTYYYCKFILNQDVIEIHLIEDSSYVITAIDIFYNKSIRPFCQVVPTYDLSIVDFKNADNGPIKQSDLLELIERILKMDI